MLAAGTRVPASEARRRREVDPPRGIERSEQAGKHRAHSSFVQHVQVFAADSPRDRVRTAWSFADLEHLRDREVRAAPAGGQAIFLEVVAVAAEAHHELLVAAVHRVDARPLSGSQHLDAVRIGIKAVNEEGTVSGVIVRDHACLDSTDRGVSAMEDSRCAPLWTWTTCHIPSTPTSSSESTGSLRRRRAIVGYKIV